MSLDFKGFANHHAVKLCVLISLNRSVFNMNLFINNSTTSNLMQTTDIKADCFVIHLIYLRCESFEEDNDEMKKYLTFCLCVWKQPEVFELWRQYVIVVITFEDYVNWVRQMSPLTCALIPRQPSLTSIGVNPICKDWSLEVTKPLRFNSLLVAIFGR